MKGEPIRHPRKIGKHIAAVLDLLAEGGATDVQVFKTKHLRICFRIGAKSFEMSGACTPRDADNFILVFKRRLRLLVEDALVLQLAGEA